VFSNWNTKNSMGAGLIGRLKINNRGRENNKKTRQKRVGCEVAAGAQVWPV